MAVKWLREKCLFLPVWPPWHAPRCRLTLAHPAIFGLGLGLVLRLGQYGRPSLATAGLLVRMSTSGRMNCKTNSVYMFTFKQWYLTSSSCIEWVSWNYIAPPQKIKLHELIIQLHEFHTNDDNNIKIPISLRTTFWLTNDHTTGAFSATEHCYIRFVRNRHLKTNKCKKICKHTHTQPFYGSVEFVREPPGEPVPEETFTHYSHRSYQSSLSAFSI